MKATLCHFLSYIVPCEFQFTQTIPFTHEVTFFSRFQEITPKWMRPKYFDIDLVRNLLLAIPLCISYSLLTTNKSTEQTCTDGSVEVASTRKKAFLARIFFALSIGLNICLLLVKNSLQIMQILVMNKTFAMLYLFFVLYLRRIDLTCTI